MFKNKVEIYDDTPLRPFQYVLRHNNHSIRLYLLLKLLIKQKNLDLESKKNKFTEKFKNNVIFRQKSFFFPVNVTFLYIQFILKSDLRIFYKMYCMCNYYNYVSFLERNFHISLFIIIAQLSFACNATMENIYKQKLCNSMRFI